MLRRRDYRTTVSHEVSLKVLQAAPAQVGGAQGLTQTAQEGVNDTAAQPDQDWKQSCLDGCQICPARPYPWPLRLTQLVLAARPLTGWAAGMARAALCHLTQSGRLPQRPPMQHRQWHPEGARAHPPELAGPSQAALRSGHARLLDRALHAGSWLLQTLEAPPTPARIHEYQICMLLL